MGQNNRVVFSDLVCPGGSDAVTVHEHIDDDASVRTIIVTDGVGPPRRGLAPAEIDSDCGVGVPRKTQPLHLGHLDHDPFEMSTEGTGFDDPADGVPGAQ